MLRIQNHVSFKDPVGRVYTTDQMLLPLRTGAKVYTVTDHSRYLFVHFSGEDHPNENQIRVMSQCDTGRMARNNVLWPEMECYRLEDDVFCGFLARRIEIPGDVRLLSQMLSSGGFDDDDTARNLAVGLNLAKGIHAVHQTSRRYVLGAPQPRDFHVAPDGRVFCCNVYRCDLDVQDTADNRYLAPECIAMQGGLTHAGDAFSFALILFELLTGLFPFGAHEPGVEFDGEQIADMILNGESIYYYGNTRRGMEVEARLAGISPDLAELFRLAFDYCGCSRYDAMRPSISDWIGVLEKIVGKEKIEYCNHEGNVL